MTDPNTKKEHGIPSVHRFSNRADLYEQYRPGYPAALYTYLQQDVLTCDRAVIADLAAGTGIFTRPMIRWPNPLYLVEPNAKMLAIAQQKFTQYPSLHYRQSTVEQLDLPDQSIDLFTIAQAFHWLDASATKQSLMRVAKPGAQVAIIWSYRLLLEPFARAYEQFIVRYSEDYEHSSQQKMKDELLDAFFAPAKPQYKEWEQRDWLDFDTLWGRTQSYSYFPEGKGALGLEMETHLRQLFDVYQQEGKVCLPYKTKLYVGPLLGS